MTAIPIGPKTQTCQMTLRSCFPSSFIEFCSVVLEVKSKMYQPIRGQCPKTQTWKRTLRSFFQSNFVEFRSAVSEEESKMPQPIRGHGGHLLFPIELGRGRWDLASCQVSLNSIQRFQRRSRKCLIQSEAILFFRSVREKHKLGRGHWDLASCQVSLNSFQRQSRKCLSQSEARAVILFFRSA